MVTAREWEQDAAVPGWPGMTDRFPSKPVRRMYESLSVAGPRSLRSAFATVAEMIEMEVLPPEILADVVLGRRTLAQVMADLGEVMADAAADGDDPETTSDMERVAANCKAAAAAFVGS